MLISRSAFSIKSTQVVLFLQHNNLLRFQLLPVPDIRIHRHRHFHSSLNPNTQGQSTRHLNNFTSLAKKSLVSMNGANGGFRYTHLQNYLDSAVAKHYFNVTPATVHQMVVRLEERGLISRESGQPRTIRVLLFRDRLPDLESVIVVN